MKSLAKSVVFAVGMLGLKASAGANDYYSQWKPLPALGADAVTNTVAPHVVTKSVKAQAAVTSADTPIVGVMKGRSEVTATGAEHYAFPIALPPSLAGFGPGLSIDYGSSSQSSGGLMGVGWTVSGLEQITRCPQTKSQDGQAVAVNFTSSDRFCLDGQRLVAVSGTYGAAGTEYRTETDSFAKIISYGSAGTGPAYFKVWTKDGVVKEFGNTTDSVLVKNGFYHPGTVQTWALNRVSDKFTNYWTVIYQSPSVTGAPLYPSIINYAGNSAQGVQPGNSIQFGYQNRYYGDVSYQYLAGSLSTQTQVLQKVSTYVGATEAAEYRFTYGSDPSTDSTKKSFPVHSHLIGVQECHLTGGVSYCLDPTTISWSSDVGAGASQTANEGSYSPSTALSISNSGAPQFLLGTASGFTGISGPYLAQPMVADINGDGRGDIVYASANASGAISIVTTLADQASSYPKAGSGSAPAQQVLTGMASATTPHLQLADVNGDGKADLVAAYIGNYGYKVYCWLSNGAGTFVSTPVINTIDSSDLSALPPVISGAKFFIADLNGDSKLDYVAITSGASSTGPSLRVMLGAGDGSTQGSEITTAVGDPLAGSSIPGSKSIDDVEIGDLNGDGIPDLVFAVSSVNGNQPSEYVTFDPGLGNGAFEAATHIQQAFTFGQIYNLWNAEHTCSFSRIGFSGSLVDVNRDGLLDVVLHQDGNCVNTSTSPATQTVDIIAYTALSTGDGVDFSIRGGVQSGGVCETSFNSSAQISPLVFQDVDGNGTLDAVQLVDYNNQMIYMIVKPGDGDGGFGAAVCTNQLYNVSALPSGGYTFHIAVGSDVNADGMPDLELPFYWNSTTDTTDRWVGNLVVSDLNLAKDPSGTTPVQQHLVTSIARGSHLVDNFSYAALPSNMASSSPLYVEGSGSTLPIIDTNMPLLVVSQASSLLDGVAQQTTNYNYAGAKVDLNGRGFLGFSQVKATLSQSAGGQNITAVDTVNYRQDFPYTGLPVDRTHTVNGVLVSEVKSSVAAGDTTCTTSPVAAVVQDFSCSSPYSGVYFPQVNNSTAWSYDPTNTTSTLLAGSSDSRTFDPYGNLLTDTSAQQNTAIGQTPTFKAVATSANTYYTDSTDIAAWYVNLLQNSSTRVVRTMAGVSGPGVTHSSSYNYSNGVLGSSIKEPGIPALSVTSVFGYDAYGNLLSTQISGAGDSSITAAATGIATRTGTATYQACASGSACAG